MSEEANRRVPEAMLCNVEVVTKSGQRYSSEVDYHKGPYKNPLTDAEVEEKFRSLTDGVIPGTRTDGLLGRLWNLEQVAHVNEMIGRART